MSKLWKDLELERGCRPVTSPVPRFFMHAQACDTDISSLRNEPNKALEFCRAGKGSGRAKTRSGLESPRASARGAAVVAQSGLAYRLVQVC